MRSPGLGAVVVRIQNLGILTAIIFGGISVWEDRFDMDADGMSYLDMADAYARRDWENALNSVWSPLYSWMLIPVLRGLKPDAYWEFPLVQGTNFLIYLGALAAFTYCLRQLILYRHWRAGGETSRPAVRSVPEWMMYAVGYAVFMWGALIAIGITDVTPHIALAALTFLTTGLLLRLRMHPEAWRSWVAFGLVLGLSYLARAQSLVFVAVYFVLAILPPPAGWLRAKRMVLRPLLALGMFVMVASVYAIPLLVVKNQFAGHDLVRLNYAWYVNGVDPRHWQGDPQYGAPVHPTRVLFTEPTVFEFDGPVGGTYPPWYDPSYWYKGVKPRFDLMGHMRLLGASLRWKPVDHRTIFYWGANVVVYVLFTGFLLRRRLLPWGSMKEHSGLLIPALIALATYPTFTILPGRFLGAFLPLLWLGTIASVSWRAGHPEGSRMTTAVVIGVIIFHLALSTAAVGDRALKSVAAPASHVQWQVAQGLHASGVPQGSKVAIMGGTEHNYWARLARVRIVAEIPREYAPEFWGASDERKHEVVAGLQAIGVRAIVVRPGARPGAPIPDGGGLWRWSDLNGTGHLALILR